MSVLQALLGLGANLGPAGMLGGALLSDPERLRGFGAFGALPESVRGVGPMNAAEQPSAAQNFMAQNPMLTPDPQPQSGGPLAWLRQAGERQNQWFEDNEGAVRGLGMGMSLMQSAAPQLAGPYQRRWRR